MELYTGDSYEYMRTLKDKSIGVIVTDPPYGIGENNTKNMSRIRSNYKWRNPKAIDYGDYDWDSKPITHNEIAEILRCSCEQVIFGGNYYTLPPSSGWIVWDKKTSGDYADCELAWTSYDRAIRMFSYLWSGFKKQKPEKRYHPTQKPLALMLWVIENYTSANELVYDPYMGSGTTGVACQILGRPFIGGDRNPKYVAIAERRIAQAALQPGLFTASNNGRTLTGATAPEIQRPEQAELFK